MSSNAIEEQQSETYAQVPAVLSLLYQQNPVS
jgi:hypothetical protein